MYRTLLSLTALSACVCAQQPIGQLLNSTASLSNLTSLVSTYAPQLLTTLSSASNITILAPSNAAFKALGNLPMMADMGSFVESLVSYHVVNGSYTASELMGMPKFLPTMLSNPAYANVTGGQRVESMAMDGSVGFYSGEFTMSMVSQANVNASNDVTVHVIDKVLSIPPPIGNISIDANLTSLTGALTQSNLVAALTDMKDVTIFAPTNMAFQSIGSALGTLSMMDLTRILSYHVVNNSVLYSTTLMDGASVPTVAGPNITVHLEGDRVFVNSAEVTTPDVLIANGVLHVIDDVLNPNNTAGPSASATMGMPAYSGASSGTAPPFTSGVATPTSTLSTPTMMMTGMSGSATGGAAASSSSAAGADAPMKTGAMGAAALLGAAGALVLNY
ncbi:MAG: hypothetical protein Q9227_006063 [Pyrenula ochraceoflavens]